MNVNETILAILSIVPTAYLDYRPSADSTTLEWWMHAGPGEIVNEVHGSMDAAVASFAKALLPKANADLAHLQAVTKVLAQ
jgi:hypothetical protein